MLVERWPVGRQARPDEAAVEADSWHREEAHLLTLEARVVSGRVGHADQPSVGRVRPAVVGAPEMADVPALALAQSGPTVTTSVEEHMDLAVLVARDDHRLA